MGERLGPTRLEHGEIAGCFGLQPSFNFLIIGQERAQIVRSELFRRCMPHQRRELGPTCGETAHRSVSMKHAQDCANTAGETKQQGRRQFLSAPASYVIGGASVSCELASARSMDEVAQIKPKKTVELRAQVKPAENVGLASIGGEGGGGYQVLEKQGHRSGALKLKRHCGLLTQARTPPW